MSQIEMVTTPSENSRVSQIRVPTEAEFHDVSDTIEDSNITPDNTELLSDDVWYE